MEESTTEQIKEHIHDKRFFSARGILYVSQHTGFPPDLVAQISVALISLYLLASDNAHFLANSLLVAYPTAATFVFPEERPSRDHLLIYWTLFGVLTWFDRVLEAVPAYYVMKMAALILLFLEPYVLVVKMKKAIKEKHMSKEGVFSERELLLLKNAKSPPPEKPDSTHLPPSSLEKTSEEHRPAKTSSARSRLASPKTSPMNTARLPVELLATTPDYAAQAPTTPTSSSESKKSALINSSKQYTESFRMPVAGGSSSLVDVPGRERFKGTNPMLTDKQFQMSTTSSAGSGAENREIGPGLNPHDLQFLPMNKIVFNGPFDYENITYHMRIQNTAHHKIAFAIKSNAVPRIIAYPPSGILQPQQITVIAVTARKFDWNPDDFNRDRIAFEYVLLKDSQSSVTRFDHGLLQQADLKRRKNIAIEYNP